MSPPSMECVMSSIEKDFKTHFNLQTWGEKFFIVGQAAI
jgi:hypothetical protein